MDTKEEDYVEHVFNCSAHDWMLFFTEQGRMYFKKAYQIPEGGPTARGKALVNFLDVRGDEKLAAIIPVRGFDPDRHLFFATEKGKVKKTPLEAYKNVRTAGIIAINIGEGDRLISVELTSDADDLLLVTRKGKGIRFNEKNARSMGRTAAGVRGISLGEGDVVKGIEVVREDAMLLTVTENGYGKRTAFSDYRVQRRGGKGLIANQLTEKTGELVTAISVHDSDAIMIVTKMGTMIRMPVLDVRMTGRSAQGVKLINIGKKDVVMSAALVDPDPEEEEIPPAEGEEGVPPPVEGEEAAVPSAKAEDIEPEAPAEETP